MRTVVCVGWGVLHCIYPKSKGGHSEVKVENGQGQLRRNGPLIYSQLWPETNPSRSGMWREIGWGTSSNQAKSTLWQTANKDLLGSGKTKLAPQLAARLFQEKNLRSWV